MNLSSLLYAIGIGCLACTLAVAGSYAIHIIECLITRNRRRRYADEMFVRSDRRFPEWTPPGDLDDTDEDSI